MASNNADAATRPDPALAALCEASREAVAELIFETNGGWFGKCPICGRVADDHPKEAS